MSSKDFTQNLPLLDVKGNPKVIGYAHGEFARSRIQEAFQLYRDLFCRFSDKRLSELSLEFAQNIKTFCPEYGVEIEAIAEAAGLDPWCIYMLNARTEIHRHTDKNSTANECTTLYFKDSCLLGENWDWLRALEKLAITMRVERTDGHRILMITEPGIIGKIGLNSAGLGVCLNILKCDARVKGVPVHVLLRSVLDSKSVEEAVTTIRSADRGTMSNIMIADNKGDCVNLELAGDTLDVIRGTNNVSYHTNHYSGCGLENQETGTASSYSRFERMKNLTPLKGNAGLQEMQKILLDRCDETLPICRPWEVDADQMEIGTVCSFIADLKNLKMHFTRGHPLENAFESLAV